MRRYLKWVVLFVCLITILTGCSQSSESAKELEQEYSIVSNKVFHLLVDEYLDTNDPSFNPKKSVLKRVYKVYDGNLKKTYEITDSISMSGEIVTITQAKSHLLENYPQSLQLRPLTIVDKQVLNQWEIEEYKAEYEYWEESPRTLTYEQVAK